MSEHDLLCHDELYGALTIGLLHLESLFQDDGCKGNDLEFLVSMLLVADFSHSNSRGRKKEHPTHDGDVSVHPTHDGDVGIPVDSIRRGLCMSSARSQKHQTNRKHGHSHHRRNEPRRRTQIERVGEQRLSDHDDRSLVMTEENEDEEIPSTEDAHYQIEQENNNGTTERAV